MKKVKLELFSQRIAFFCAVLLLPALNSLPVMGNGGLACPKLRHWWTWVLAMGGLPALKSAAV